MSEPPITVEPIRPVLAYPGGLARRALKAPLLLYRLGLGRLLPPTILLLTTTGRRSGRPRTAALESRRHGSKLYVVSIWGTRADWYRNLLADPLVRVQVGGRSFAGRAVPIADANELWRVLHLFRRGNPLLDAILEGTAGLTLSAHPHDLDRHRERLAGVRLEPADAPDAPPALRPDLAWLWGVGLALVVGLVAVTWRRRRP
mgnify:CR=1 FL=1